MASDRISLACRAHAHDECTISWCTCKCHETTETTCWDCGTETLSAEPGAPTEYYMVHDHIWAAAHADPRAWLWVGCLEARLDRQLHWGDFTAAGVNDVTIKPTPRFA